MTGDIEICHSRDHIIMTSPPPQKGILNLMTVACPQLEIQRFFKVIKRPMDSSTKAVYVVANPLLEI